MDFQCSRLDIFGTMDNVLYRCSWYAIRMVVGVSMNVKLTAQWDTAANITTLLSDYYINMIWHNAEHLDKILTEPRLAMRKSKLQIRFCPSHRLFVVVKILGMFCCQAIKQPQHMILCLTGLWYLQILLQAHFPRKTNRKLKKGCPDIRRPQKTADILDMLLIIHEVAFEHSKMPVIKPFKLNSYLETFDLLLSYFLEPEP